MSEFDELFTAYANEGYQIVMRERYRPREELTLETDATGAIALAGKGVLRVLAARGEDGREIWGAMRGDGTAYLTGKPGQRVALLCEMEAKPLVDGEDEPAFPSWAHGALADYICYRHLSGGNLAKQQRAQFFLSAFAQTMRRIQPQGSGSVTRMKNLYAASDVRNVYR